MKNYNLKNKDFTYQLENKRYNHNNNYDIEIVNSNSRLCYIFCSSNGIYTSINESNYKDYIAKDYYEWKNVSKNKILRNQAGMYIFLRDVFQRSYVNGINTNICNIDKLIEFLKIKTEGYEIIIVGNSGGGYLAIILGSQLVNVKRVYSFGGLLSLYTWTGSNNNVTFSNTYKDQIGDKNKEKWFSLYNIVRNYPTTLLHFYGSKHPGDVEQVRPIIEENLQNVFLIKMDSSIHSGHIPGYNYPKLLSSTDEKHIKRIKRLSRKDCVSQNYFSIVNIGLMHLLFYKGKSIIKHIFKI